MSSIKNIIKINLTCFFLKNVATRKFKVPYVACIVFVLENTILDIVWTLEIQS